MNKEKLVTISSYGNYSSSNYGAHCMRVTIPQSAKNKHGITLYFSYDTLIAFNGFISEEKHGLFVIKNYWRTTTGKHLNFINSNKEKRLDEKIFNALFNKAIKNA